MHRLVYLKGFGLPLPLRCTNAFLINVGLSEILFWLRQTVEMFLYESIVYLLIDILMKMPKAKLENYSQIPYIETLDHGPMTYLFILLILHDKLIISGKIQTPF